ncbi:hypothetical protein BU24DRAFT_124530 [Aaosphaeria arxii CBS 175.79]|uniref:Uncharacterized protein n=1 Tax=Aaosphaeria arxii CBS 175.79 TaxID=1450172 RepID=A0A6A5Y446_9PLEO|nr:uncharacterized protein BU24DRAFT_124530 [Aaosphaeria arxii CBS 175.79]KAF2019651.1 hypothetical protein BU24DRAFT_124530 [Aaosphaeria arxii CBS 175.79]
MDRYLMMIFFFLYVTLCLPVFSFPLHRRSIFMVSKCFCMRSVISSLRSPVPDGSLRNICRPLPQTRRAKKRKRERERDGREPGKMNAQKPPHQLPVSYKKLGKRKSVTNLTMTPGL